MDLNFPPFEDKSELVTHFLQTEYCRMMAYDFQGYFIKDIIVSTLFDLLDQLLQRKSATIS